MNKKEMKKLANRVPSDVLVEVLSGLEQVLRSLPSEEAVRLLNENGTGTYDLSASNLVKLGEVRMVHRVAQRVVNRVGQPVTLGDLLDWLPPSQGLPETFAGVAPKMPDPPHVVQDNSPPFVTIPCPLTFDEVDRRLAAKAGKQ